MSDGLSLPIDLAELKAALVNSALAKYADSIVETTERVMFERRHGDVPRWLEGLNRLPSPEQLTDLEWRSDWKWQRIEQALSALEGRSVLDVGCGNGYHLWRLKAAGAATVLGIDPSPLFVVQFLAMQRYVQDSQVNLLPLSMEQFDAPGAFDTVLSMGVLSHRREPMEHLRQLKRCLRPGGELLLETLVLPGEHNDLSSIDGRYARSNSSIGLVK